MYLVSCELSHVQHGKCAILFEWGVEELLELLNELP